MSNSPPGRAIRRILTRSDDAESRVLADILRQETTGGILLLGGTALALAWANSPWRQTYRAVLDTAVGPHALHLDLTLAQWAADGLLAIFFFVAGVELKRELVVGDLREPAKAVLPVVAAVCGVALPALVFLAVTAGDPSVRTGWAVPVATDIAFALAVLAVLGSHLPTALRSFLLTLAVVDDLIAITIIAIFYTDGLSWLPLLGAAVPLAVFGLLTQRRVTSPYLLVPLALLTWALVHASGIHATVAGVLLGMVVPVRCRVGEQLSVGERMEHELRPLSAGLAVPVFAVAAAGVSVVGGGFGPALADPVFAGIVTALVVGKAVGVLGGTWLTTRLTRADLDPALSWWDVLGVSLLAGIGFTVSLLVGELAFGTGSDRDEHVKLAVLTGSLVAAVLAALVLGRRNRVYRRLEELEQTAP